MSEMAQEELRNRINGLSDEEKVLVLNEMPFELLFEVFISKVDQLVEVRNSVQYLIDSTSSAI